MTTLRNSQLLNAHALILAEKVNPRDMAEYAGLVSFVNVHQVPNEWNRLMRLPIDKRQALADDRAAAFKERFHPKVRHLYSNARPRDRNREGASPQPTCSTAAC